MVSDFATQRVNLKDANVLALEGQLSLKLSAKLDSSLKKNTSFIKKIKGLNVDTASGILADISALTLEKYLSEITASLAEGLLKMSKNDDINTGVVVISALFQRFGQQFSGALLSHMVNACVEKVDPEPVLRQKTALKVVFEMQIVGITLNFSDCASDILNETAAKYFSKFRGELVSVSLLKDIMGYKLAQGYSLSVVTTFLKRFSGVLNSELLTEAQIAQLSQLFDAYTGRIFELLKSLHAKEEKLETSNKKASIRTGKILAEHQDLVDEISVLRTHFETHAQVLCELLGRDMPSFQPVKDVEEQDAEGGQQTLKTWWHDSKEREFYQDVPSHSDIIKSFDKRKLPYAKYKPLSEGQRVVLFISQLEGLLDAKDLDLMTATMHTFIPYNKATRHRLIRFFSEVRKIDNVNLYARFLKINAGFFPGVIEELIEGLDRGFRSQIHFDTLNFRNLAFFIELVKFKLIQSHVVFHKIRRMTLNVGGTSNVDILSVFYERCGKFLLFEPEYSDTTKEMLDLLRAQAKSDKLTISEKLALSNMFLIVNSFTAPPQASQAAKPKLTVLQDFIHQCVKKLVTPTSFSLSLKILSSIDFSKSEEARLAFIDVFLKPEDLGADRLITVCELLLELGKKHRHLAVSIIDGLTEKVIRGLECNDYRRNLSRMAQVKLFAALFNSRVLNFRSILDLLYKIVCFGYPNNLPMINANLDIDAPENYFRIQLVCTLLKAVNLHKVSSMGLLNNGVKTVEGFLVFLHYYTFCKISPLPKDIEFALSSVLESFNAVSKVKVQAAPDLASAMQALQKYISDHTQGDMPTSRPSSDSISHGSESIVSEDSDASDSEFFESSDEDLDSDIEESIVDESVHSSFSKEPSSEVSSDSETEAEYEEEEEEEEHTFQLRSSADALEAQRMDDEISNLLSTTMYNSKPGVPLKMPPPSSFLAPVQNDTEPPKIFKFLTKTNRLRDLSLPTNNQFTERIASEQAAQKANRMKIMSLVNNMYEN